MNRAPKEAGGLKREQVRRRVLALVKGAGQRPGGRTQFCVCGCGGGTPACLKDSVAGRGLFCGPEPSLAQVGGGKRCRSHGVCRWDLKDCNFIYFCLQR